MLIIISRIKMMNKFLVPLLLLSIFLIGCAKSEEFIVDYAEKHGDVSGYEEKLYDFKINNIVDCNEFKDTQIFYDCLMELWMTTDDAAVCEAEDDISKPLCYDSIATNTKNEAFCGKGYENSIEYDDRLGGCLAVVRNDVQSCSK